MDHTKWDKRFLRVAREIASWSKDPSTKSGCVIIDEDRRIISTGYNGFSRAISDDPRLLHERGEKYRRVIHSDMNALLFARRDLKKCTVYTWPFISCARCSIHLIQMGMWRHVTMNFENDAQADRWRDTSELTVELLREAGVALTIYPRNFLNE